MTGPDPRAIALAAQLGIVRRGGMSYLKSEAVDITKPPFTDRYPELRGFLAYDGLRMKRANRNVAVRCNNFVNGNWEIDQCLVTQEDPGFVDWEKQNFALRKDAALFARIPGFVPIPFAQIGLIRDEYRTVIDRTAAP